MILRRTAPSSRPSALTQSGMSICRIPTTRLRSYSLLPSRRRQSRRIHKDRAVSAFAGGIAALFPGNSMIPKSGYRFSEKIMLQQADFAPTPAGAAPCPARDWHDLQKPRQTVAAWSIGRGHHVTAQNAGWLAEDAR